MNRVGLLLVTVLALSTAVQGSCPFAHLGRGEDNDRRLQELYDAEISLLELKEERDRQLDSRTDVVKVMGLHHDPDDEVDRTTYGFYTHSSDSSYRDLSPPLSPKRDDGAEALTLNALPGGLDAGLGGAGLGGVGAVPADPPPFLEDDDDEEPPKGAMGDMHDHETHHDEGSDNASRDEPPSIHKSVSTPDVLHQIDRLMPTPSIIVDSGYETDSDRTAEKLPRVRSHHDLNIGSMNLMKGSKKWLENFAQSFRGYDDTKPEDRTKLLKHKVQKLSNLMKDNDRIKVWANSFRMLALLDFTNTDGKYDVFEKKNGFEKGYVSTVYGFLPPEFPLTKLKSAKGSQHPLDEFFNKLKDYIRDGTIRDKVTNEFPDFDVDDLQPKERGRAWMMLGSIVNGYLNLDKRNYWVDPKRIPESIAKPFWALHDKMKKKMTNPLMTWPVLTYYDMVLQNFEMILDEGQQLHQTYMAFLGSDSVSSTYNGPKHVYTMGQWASSANNETNICERVFYTTMVKMHWDGRDIPATVARVQQLIRIYLLSKELPEESGARDVIVKMITSDINHLSLKVSEVTAAFQQGMGVTSDPNRGCSHMDWYMNVAPWAQGPDPIMWARQKYDNDDLPLCPTIEDRSECNDRLDCMFQDKTEKCIARSAVGPSGLQFPITNLLDAFISRQIYASPIGKEAVVSRQFLAPYHKFFVAFVEGGPCLREFVQYDDPTTKSLRGHFNELVDEVKKFLQVHNLKAAGFLLEGITKAEGRVTGTSGQMANKAEVESEKTKEDVTTGIMRFLNAGVPERDTARVRAYRKYSVEWKYDVDLNSSRKLKTSMDDIMSYEKNDASKMISNIMEYDLVPTQEIQAHSVSAYTPGATLRVFCRNDQALVDRTARALQVKKKHKIWLKSAPWFEAASHPDARVKRRPDAKGLIFDNNEVVKQDGPGAREISLQDFLSLANLRPWNCRLGQRFVRLYNSLLDDKDADPMSVDDCETDMADAHMKAGYDFADYLGANLVWREASESMRMRIVQELPELLTPQRTRQYSLANHAEEDDKEKPLPLMISTVQYGTREQEYDKTARGHWIFRKGIKKGVCSQNFYKTARAEASSYKHFMHVSVDDAIGNDRTFTGTHNEYLTDLRRKDFKIILFAGGSGLGPMWSIIQYRLQHAPEDMSADNTWLLLSTKNLIGGVPRFKEMKDLAISGKIRVSIALSGERTCSLSKTKDSCEGGTQYLRCEWHVYNEIDNLGRCREIDHGNNFKFYPGCRLTECKKSLRQKSDGWYQFPLLHDAKTLYSWTESLLNETNLATNSHHLGGSMVDMMSSRILKTNKYNSRLYLCGSMAFQNSVTQYLTKMVQMSRYPSIEMARIVVHSWMKAGAYRIEAFSDDQKFQGMDRSDANQVSMVYTEMDVRAESRWMVYDNTVINVAEYLKKEQHPGGNSQIESYIGQDITDVIQSLQHPVSAILQNAEVMGRLVTPEEKDKLRHRCEITMDLSEEIVVCEESDSRQCQSGANQNEWNRFIMQIRNSKELDGSILDKVFPDPMRRDRIKRSDQGEPVVMMYKPTSLLTEPMDELGKMLLADAKFTPSIPAGGGFVKPKKASPGGFSTKPFDPLLDIVKEGEEAPVSPTEEVPVSPTLAHVDPSSTRLEGAQWQSPPEMTSDSFLTPDEERLTAAVQEKYMSHMTETPIHSFSFDDITSVPTLLSPIDLAGDGRDGPSTWYPFMVKRRVFKGREETGAPDWLDSQGSEIVFDSDVGEQSLVVCFSDERKRNAFAALITTCVNSMYNYQPLDPMNTFRYYLVQRRRTEMEVEVSSDQNVVSLMLHGVMWMLTQVKASLKGLDGSYSKRAEKVKDLLLKVIQGVDDTVTSSLSVKEREEEEEEEKFLKWVAGLGTKDKLGLALPDLGFGWLRASTDDERFSMGIKDTADLIKSEKRQLSVYGDDLDSLEEFNKDVEEEQQRMLSEIASRNGKGSGVTRSWSTDALLAYILSQEDNDFHEHMLEVDSATMEDDAGYDEPVPNVPVSPTASEFDMTLSEEQQAVYGP